MARLWLNLETSSVNFGRLYLLTRSCYIIQSQSTVLELLPAYLCFFPLATWDKFNCFYVAILHIFEGSHQCLFFPYLSPSHGSLFLWINSLGFFNSCESRVPSCNTVLFLLSILFIFVLLVSDPLRACHPTFTSIVKREMISSLFLIIIFYN